MTSSHTRPANQAMARSVRILWWRRTMNRVVRVTPTRGGRNRKQKKKARFYRREPTKEARDDEPDTDGYSVVAGETDTPIRPAKGRGEN